MFLGVRLTPFSFAELPFSPPFFKQNGGELTPRTVPERSIEIVFRLTLAVSGLSDRRRKQPPHSFPISDFLTSRPEARPLQHRADAPDRLTLIRPPLDATSLRRGRFSSGDADRPASVGLHRDASLPIRRSPSHA